MSAPSSYYRVLALLLPKRFRKKYGDEMADLISKMTADATRRSPLGQLVFHARTTVDLLALAVRARLQGPRDRSRERTRRTDRGAYARDVVFAWKGLRRAPGPTALAVGALAVGIGLTAAIFGTVDAVLLRPLPYPEADRLALVFNEYRALGSDRGGQNPGDFFDFRDRTRTFDAIEAFSGAAESTISGLGAPFRASAAGATDEFFPLLGIEPVLGRGFLPEDDYRQVVVSHEFWRTRLGGTTDALSRSFAMRGDSYTVIGVLPDDFALRTPGHLAHPLQVDIWNPIRRYLGPEGARDRTAHWMTTLLRIRPGATFVEAQADLDAVAEWQRATFPVRAERDGHFVVAPMHAEIVREARPALLALFGAAAVVLLIACTNVATLLLARGQTRVGEMAIRKALGGTRSRLIGQLLTEGLLLGAMGAVAGVGIALAGVETIQVLSPGDVPFVDRIRVDGTVLAFIAAAAASSAIVFGLFPAIQGTGATARSLCGSHRGLSSSQTASRVRSGLVVAEVALSVTLLAGGGLMIRSFHGLGEVDPGYAVDDVLTLTIDVPREVWDGELESDPRNLAFEEFFRRAADSLETIPEVVSAAAVWPTPLNDERAEGYSTYTVSEDPDDQGDRMARSILVTPGYFETMDIRVLEGRALRTGDAGDVLVIDRAMADKVWPGRSAIGQSLKIGWWSGPVWGRVVGVVESVRTATLNEPDFETVYRMASVYAYSAPTVVIRTRTDPMEVAGRAQGVARAIHPEATVHDVHPLGYYHERQRATTRFVMALIGSFAAVALVLALVALYGVISLVVGQRRHEFAIRMAMGATGQHLFRIVVGQGVRLVVIGTVLGLVGALFTGEVLTAWLFGVSPMDPVTLVGTGALILLAAVGASMTPALRAVGTDPVGSLNKA